MLCTEGCVVHSFMLLSITVWLIVSFCIHLWHFRLVYFHLNVLIVKFYTVCVFSFLCIILTSLIDHCSFLFGILFFQLHYPILSCMSCISMYTDVYPLPCSRVHFHVRLLSFFWSPFSLLCQLSSSIHSALLIPVESIVYSFAVFSHSGTTCTELTAMLFFGASLNSIVSSESNSCSLLFILAHDIAHGCRAWCVFLRQITVHSWSFCCSFVSSILNETHVLCIAQKEWNSAPYAAALVTSNSAVLLTLSDFIAMVLYPQII